MNFFISRRGAIFHSFTKLQIFQIHFKRGKPDISNLNWIPTLFIIYVINSSLAI